MHSSEVTGDGLRRRPKGTGALLALAIIFLALAGSPAHAAGAEAPSTGPKPPMILPSDAESSASGGSASSSVSGWIVGGIPDRRTSRIAKKLGGKAINGSPGSYRIVRDRARALAQRLQKSGRLVYAEPDLPLTRTGYPADLLSDQQWWLNRIVSPSDVTPPAVTSASPLIALVEESLDVRHPDLAEANLTGAHSIGPAADNHGTSVAAIAGSPGEMRGIRGVWPGARMRLFPSGLSCSTASKAVTRAVNQGAAVINMSYTFPSGVCFTHFKATQFAVLKGAILVAAAGNSAGSGNAPMRPAVDPHVISVGAVDDAGLIAPFSTRNSGVDLVAPGVDILAPVVTTGKAGAGTSGEAVHDWQTVSGTSFAAPMVSAAAAWLKQLRPNLGNLQIARLLTNSSTDLGDPGRDPFYGEGLLSIEQSIAAPVPVTDPYEPNDDIRWLNGSLLKPKAPFLWRPKSGKRRVLTATLSRAKDPADVYRVLIPARRRVVVNVTQIEGDIVVSALKPSAKTIVKPARKLIVQSNRPYPKTEGIIVRNLKPKAQAFWLAVTPASADPGNNFTYRVKIVRR